ncbi:hypothetical protein M514_11670 [Trichuris suis]|uniref:Uncharacterized protein n=1 Tax=Trichuris suis TaxID=68888 RepID=A0A085MTS7_9BILA|nr:hypothetical protein M514_11670 [Trichuris suis]
MLLTFCFQSLLSERKKCLNEIRNGGAILVNKLVGIQESSEPQGKDFEGPLLYDSGEPSPIITGLPRPTRSQLYAVFPWRLKTFYTFPKSGGHEHMRGSSSVETISDRASH